MICQVAVHQGREVYAFTRPGDTRTQEFARSAGRHLGRRQRRAAARASSTPRSSSPRPARSSPPRCKALAPGGTVVCAGIHMSDIPSFPYEDLWHERSIRSVANLTRDDGHEFLALAPRGPGPHHDHHLPARRRPSRRSPTCAPARFEGTAVAARLSAADGARMC